MSDYNHSSTQLLNHTEKMFFGIFIFVVALFQMTVAQAADITPTAILELVNAERSKAGLGSLKENAVLSSAAEAKLNNMFQNDYFSHTSPKGETPWHWIKQSGYAYQYAGENLAINYSSAEKQHNAWMKSETHRANILSSKFTETGIAVRSGKLNGEEAVITVEMFGAPRFAQTHKTVQQSPRTEEVRVQQVPNLFPVAVENKQMVLENEALPQENQETVPITPRILSAQEVPFWQESWFQMINMTNWSPTVLYQLTLGVALLMLLVALIFPCIFVYEMAKYLLVSWWGNQFSLKKE